MQNRYVGDIGDFVKLALLRELAPDRRLGIAWWLYPDESHNKDGRHIDYLKSPEQWRHLDTKVFDALNVVIASNIRDVVLLENGGFLPDAKFYRKQIPVDGSPTERVLAREKWFSELQLEMADRDLIFLDPDNGLEPSRFSFGIKKAGKSAAISELLALKAPGRALVIYHHQTRRKGGHVEEIAYRASQLLDAGFSSVDAIRSQPYSPRMFFLLNASPELRRKAEAFALRWKGSLSWHPAG